jgi:hypothetical protein
MLLECKLFRVENKRLKSYLFFIVLMRNKYFLYIINKKIYSENIIDLLKDFLYIYKYRGWLPLPFKSTASIIKG